MVYLLLLIWLLLIGINLKNRTMDIKRTEGDTETFSKEEKDSKLSFADVTVAPRGNRKRLFTILIIVLLVLIFAALLFEFVGRDEQLSNNDTNNLTNGESINSFETQQVIEDPFQDEDQALDDITFSNEQDSIEPAVNTTDELTQQSAGIESSITDNVTGTQLADISTIQASEIPKRDTYTVKKGDNLWNIAKQNDVYNDPWGWRTILVQNKNKISQTIYNDSGKWKVLVREGVQLSIPHSESGINGTSPRKYAVQVMSLEENKFNKALEIVNKLLHDNYYAYLYQTPQKIATPKYPDGMYFYRIRVGFYETQAEARQIGAEIYTKYRDKNLFPRDYWVMRPSSEELSGILLDFGVQLKRPYIVELAETTYKDEAISNMRTSSPYADYSYIVEQSKANTLPLYKNRLGFFASEREARRAMQRIQQETDTFYSAEIVEVEKISEAIIGQNAKNTRK